MQSTLSGSCMLLGRFGARLTLLTCIGHVIVLHCIASSINKLELMDDWMNWQYNQARLKLTAEPKRQAIKLHSIIQFQALASLPSAHSSRIYVAGKLKMITK